MAGIIVKFDKARLCPFALAEGTVRPNALIALPQDVVQDCSVEDVAEAVFEATNAPFELPEGSLAARIRGWFANRTGKYPALSVGDTVQLRKGAGENLVVDTVRVEPIGFSKVGA